MVRVAQKTKLEGRDVAIHVRARRKQRELIDRAAHLRGQSRSEFLLAAACQEAENALLDQTNFSVTPDQFLKFMDALDSYPTKNEGIERLFRVREPWN